MTPIVFFLYIVAGSCGIVASVFLLVGMGKVLKAFQRPVEEEAGWPFDELRISHDLDRRTVVFEFRRKGQVRYAVDMPMTQLLGEAGDCTIRLPGRQMGNRLN